MNPLSNHFKFFCSLEEKIGNRHFKNEHRKFIKDSVGNWTINRGKEKIGWEKSWLNQN